MMTPYGTFTYTYDALDRLTSITNPSNEVTTFVYDDISRRDIITYDNGVATTYTFDAASRLTNILTRDPQLVTFNSYIYTYDDVGNRTSMTDNDGLHEYAYDDVYQLEGATHPQAYNPDESFTYDPVGNRLTSHLSSDYVYDNLNRLLEDDGYTYGYDNNGNLITKVDKVSSATTTYQYDAEDRLVQVTTPTDVIQYQYDGFGRRNVRTLNGVVTRYVYDQEDILFEFDENNQIKARYTHGPGIDEPISVDRDTDADGTFDTTYYYHYDGLGSVTVITDASGNVVQTYVYDAFGKIVQQTGSVENVYTYTGREWDAEAGLYFYRARYYDPTIGRFINGDPIGFAGGDVNFYVYVQNNPVNRIDPWGLYRYKHPTLGWIDVPDDNPSEAKLIYPVPAPETEAINKVLPKEMIKFGTSLGLGVVAELYPTLSLFTDILSNLDLIKAIADILDQELFEEKNKCRK
jgi:RHS repeat-associated protein